MYSVADVGVLLVLSSVADSYRVRMAWFYAAVVVVGLHVVGYLWR